MMLTRTLVVAAALTLIAGVAFAQTCPPATTVQPSAQAGLPVYPAGIGAGPAPKLMNLTGTAFDRAYLRDMFQHSSDILVLTSLAVTRLPDITDYQGMNLKSLYDLSAKVREEQTRQNQKWAQMSRQMGFGPMPPMDFTRVQIDVNRINGEPGPQAAIDYARTLGLYLTQQRDAATLAIARSPSPEVRNQSQIITKATTNEIQALANWVNKAHQSMQQ